MNPASVRLLREAAGLTRLQLAEVVGASRQLIGAIEDGKRAADVLMKAALADALGVSQRALSMDLRSVDLSALHFRKKARVALRTQHEMVARAGLFEHAERVIESYASLPPVDFPTVSSIDESSITAVAADCRKRWGLSPDAPIDNLVRVLERAGVVVGEFADSTCAVDGFSWSRARPFVLVNSMVAPTRRRFSLAHECAHLVLHQAKTGEPQQEHEADAFAGAFLLPREAMYREFPRYRIDWTELVRMKKRWGVSIQALVTRAYRLGIIGAARYRSAFVRISQLGWRKSEPGEPEHGEKPELLHNVIRALDSEGVLRCVDLSEATGLPQQFLEALLGYTYPRKPHGLVMLRSIGAMEKAAPKP